MGAMMIRLHATLRQIARQNTVTVEIRRGQTAGDALRALVAAHPALGPSIFHADGTLVGHVAVVLDGRDIRHLSGVDTPVGEAEKLDVFPPVGGGKH